MSLSATKNEQFSEQAYWEARYASETEEEFDWFKKYADLKALFDEVLIPSTSSPSGKVKEDIRILMLGCGNSTLSHDMYQDGYRQIVNIDYSSTCIQKMSTKFPEQVWKVMDITQLLSPSNLEALGGRESFDVAIDKGTMDALLAEPKHVSVWNPSPLVIEKVDAELQGVYELLKKDGGKFIYITFGQPHFRKPHLERIKGWTVETRTLGDMFHYYVYICTKNPDPTPDNQA